MDLQALEMLDPDSSSQEENSNDRLEAAVSLSTLSSVGLPQSLSLNTRNISRVLGSSGRGSGNRELSSGMLVIVSAPGFQDEEDLEDEEEREGDEIVQQVVSLPPLLSHQQSLEQESRSFDLDSSMESEGSNRQLEAVDPLTGDSAHHQSITVITTSSRSEETSQQQQQVIATLVEDDVLSEPIIVATNDTVGGTGTSVIDDDDSTSNNGTTARTRSRLRDNSSNTSAEDRGGGSGGGSGARSIATGYNTHIFMMYCT